MADSEDRIARWKARRGDAAADSRAARTAGIEIQSDAPTEPDAAPTDTSQSRAAALRESLSRAAPAPSAAASTARATPLPDRPDPLDELEEPGINRDLPSRESIAAAQASADERRRAIARRRRWRYLLVLGLPALLFALYALLVVTPLYEARSTFSVTTAGGDSGMATPALGIGGPSPTLAEEYEMRAFLTSRAVMKRMEEEHGYLTHLAGSADFLSGPGAPLGLGDPLGYYQRRVDVIINVQEGLATLTVQGVTRTDAERYAEILLELARERLAETSRQLNTDQLDGLEEEVATARTEVDRAATALGQVQQARGDIDPVASATAVYQLIGQLELRLSEVRAQRDALLANGLDRSPLLPRLNAQIGTIEGQIAEQRERLAGGGAQTVQRSALLLERARTQKELAEATLAATLQTLEQARVEALKRREYLVVVAPPSAPAAANVWRQAKAVAWIVLGGLAAIAIGLVAGAMRRRREADDMTEDQWPQ